MRTSNQLALLLVLITSHIANASGIIEDSFSFQHNDDTLRGIVAYPKGQKVESIVIVVHGHGKTNVKGGQWNDLRSTFTSVGIATVLWDKAGCGNSEGDYDHEQTVYSSSKEVIAAIQTIKSFPQLKNKKIGLWGISRAGFIAPLVIKEYPSIAFWISVSGTDEKESFGYLLRSNLKIEGHSDDEIEILYNEWMAGNRVFQSGGSWEEFRGANPTLRENAFVKEFFGIGDESDEAVYMENQKKHLDQEHIYDKETGLKVYVPELEEILSKIQCPVLAIVGEKDTQVDWRNTVKLYERTIPNSLLCIKRFPDGNHMIQKSKNGGLRETIANSDGWNPCDGYYSTMTNWISLIKSTSNYPNN